MRNFSPSMIMMMQCLPAVQRLFNRRGTGKKKKGYRGVRAALFILSPAGFLIAVADLRLVET